VSRLVYQVGNLKHDLSKVSSKLQQTIEFRVESELLCVLYYVTWVTIFDIIWSYSVWAGSSVGIAIGYGLDGPGI
jgi:hypothetical protein